MLAFLVWTVIYPAQERQRLTRTGRSTVAVITQAGGKNVTVAYWGNGQQRHKVVSSPHPTLQRGERYMLLYDPADAATAFVLFERPVFDRRAYATTRATLVNDLWLNPSIAFEYVVDGKEYERFQEEKPGKKIDEALPATVVYNITDPRIAYLEY
jgi:hypothetical protein